MGDMRFLVVIVTNVDGCHHGWLVVVMETTMMVQRRGRDESVVRRCWYISFPNRDSAYCDAGNARQRGFSSLA